MATETIPPTKMKKLPFKPTALRKAALSKVATPSSSKESGSNEDDGLDLFRRSKEMAPTLLAEQEKRQKKHKLKREAEKARASVEKRPIADDEEYGDSNATGEHASAGHVQRRDAQGDDDHGDGIIPSSEGGEVPSLVTPPSSKRVRLDKKWSAKSSPEAASSSQSLAPDSPSTRRSRRKANLPPSKSPSMEPAPKMATPVICLDSDDDEVEDINPSQSMRSEKIREIESDDEDVKIVEDDEFAEFVQRAEEQRARDLSRDQDDVDFDTKDTRAVHVNITTRLVQGTKPCKVKVLYDKPLNKLRHSWFYTQRIHKNELPLDFTEAESILTWCGMPVYNYTSLRDLGIRPCGDNKVIAERSKRRGLADDNTMVLMEIWTPEGFRQREEEERRNRSRDINDFSDDDEQGTEEPEVTFKVKLVARDTEPAGLTVRPETTVDTVITGYRAMKGIPASHQITLWFDGEMLEEHVTMGEAEIDDLDTIEVHIKQ